MEKLQVQIAELKKCIPFYTVRNPHVSSSDVGWQIAHALLAISKIIGGLKLSEPSHYKRRFTWSKLFIMNTGFIPRGRGVSPKVILPGIYNEDVLQEHLRLAIASLKELEGIALNRYFEHPYFGDLQVADTVRFLRIHTHHHLKIIKEILHDHR